MAALELATFEVRYMSRQGWSNREADAWPVVGKLPESKDAKVPVEDRFGEIAVEIIPAEACPEDASGCQDTVVLLATQAGFVRYRTLPLAELGPAEDSRRPSWIKGARTSANGYGPYIVDRYTKVERSAKGGHELVLYHLVSSWDGLELKRRDRNPYGVFTRRLLLIDEDTCAVNGKIPVCKEVPPPWPPR